jgi:aryl-alcohol dehydrogenase-like predicted oxidoreductase
MRYRRLGRTGLSVSEVGLGTVELGMDYGIADGRGPAKPSRDEAARVLNQALDSGINFIDTARAYGASEETIGWALGARRKEYILASKVSCRAEEGQRLRDHVARSLEQSLGALETDVIDLMQLHSASAEEIRRGELADILQEVQAAGSIRFLGATTYGEEAARAALEDGRYDCVQIAYNLLDREAEERILPLAQAKEIGVVVRSVLLKGALTHRYRHLPAELAELKSAVERILLVASRASCSLPEFAYRFVLAQPAVSTLLVGTARVEELKAVIEYCAQGPLTADWEALVRAVGLEDRRALNPGSWNL